MPERSVWIPSDADAREVYCKMFKKSPVVADPRGGRWYFTWEGSLTWTAGVQQTFDQYHYSELPNRLEN